MSPGLLVWWIAAVSTLGSGGGPESTGAPGMATASRSASASRSAPESAPPSESAPPLKSADASTPMQPLADAITVPVDDACLSPGLAAPVSTWLGRDEVRADLTVEVTTDDRSVGFVLRRSGEVRVERTLSPAPADCADRRAALGLAIAMALDAAVLEALAPPVAAEPPVLPPPRDDETPLGPGEPEPGASEPATSDADAPGLRLALSAEADAIVGAMPRVGFGGELGLSLGWVPWLDLRVAGGAAGGLSTPLAGGSVGAVLGWGALELCPGRRFGPVHLRLCAGAAAGALRAQGRGFTESRVVVRPWVVVRTGGELDVRLADRVALRVRGTLLTPVVRNRLDVRDLADAVVDAEEPAPAAGQVGLGVVVRLRGPGPRPSPVAQGSGGMHTTPSSS